MKMDLGVQLKMGQQLIMTPQLQQAIKLLQLSRQELELLINQALIENPTLEVAEGEDGQQEDDLSGGDSKEDTEEDLRPDTDSADTNDVYDEEWQEYIESGASHEIRTSKSTDTDENGQNILESCVTHRLNLTEHLSRQIELGDYTEHEKSLLLSLLGYLDAEGYLSTSLRNILLQSEEIFTLIAADLKERPNTNDTAADTANIQPSIAAPFDTAHEENKPVADPKKQKKKSAPVFTEDEEISADTPLPHAASVSLKECMRLEEFLWLLQTLDPPGIGARSLEECLLLQLPGDTPQSQLARLIIQEDMKLLMQKDLKRVAKNRKADIDDVVDAFELITTLEPKPGRSFFEEITQYITPDVYVYKKGKEYVVRLNQDNLPRLRISAHYQEISKQLEQEASQKKAALKKAHPQKTAQQPASQEDDLTGMYLAEKIRAGEWLMKSIDQRQSTIYKVTESIVKYQTEFLEKGVNSLKPMILKVVAEDIGVHESTVSRITSNKFVHTPQGIFELKYFFTSGIVQSGGIAVSSEKIKDHIAKMVSEEDPKNPLTDSQITERLEKLVNIKVARRTIAKYRETLNILSSNRRKSLF